MKEDKFWQFMFTLVGTRTQSFNIGTNWDLIGFIRNADLFFNYGIHGHTESFNIFNVSYYVYLEHDIFIKREWCVDLFIKILNHCHDVLRHINMSELSLELDKPIHKQTNLDQRRFTIFYYLMVIINEVIFRSIEVNMFFGKIAMVKAIASFLTEIYIEKILMHKNVVLLLIKNLSILSRWADEHKKEWNDLNLIQTFLRIVKKFKSSTTHNGTLTSSSSDIDNKSKQETLGI